MEDTTTAMTLDTTYTSATTCDWVDYQPLVYTYYQSYYGQYWTKPNHMEQAFRVVQKLIEKKLITTRTVKQFIEAVNEVAEAL